MTRDAEHTPSPQSVVVPVEPTEAMHYAGDRMLANAVTKGGSIYDTTKAMWSAMLAAAPAPSSLAGGEKLDRFERAAFAKVQNLPRGAAARAEEIARRDAEYDAARNSILAALSTEAPAREGVTLVKCSEISKEARSACEGAMDPEDAEYWFTVGACWTADLCDERTALTPRHEAPAVDWGAIRSHPCYDEHQPGCDCDALIPRPKAPAPRPELAPYTEDLKGIKAAMLADEAPAEGAGEFSRQMEILRKAASVPVPDDDSDFTVEKARRGSESWRVIAANVLREYDRARSSAPEAREGEAVAENLRLKAALGAAIKADNALSRAVWAEGELDKIAAWLWEQGHQLGREAVADTAIVNLARLRDLSAAPSADKLREALTWALAEIQGDTRYENDGQREAALDQALAALKAEA